MTPEFVGTHRAYDKNIFMDLHEYPRPANDTGIGIHWSAGYAAAVGLSRIRDVWLPQLQALGVKWIKIFNQDGAHDFAQLLLSEGFMPILRIYRPHPNPGRLGVRELVDLDEFIRLGVRYFEFNNEPDQDASWQGGRVPVNGIDIVVEDAIADIEAILERGGMPGLPAVSCGSSWDLVGKIIERGRKDLFEGHVWQAVHNYSRNRPLDYPYDIGNQEGSSYTERFYQIVANEQFNFDPWHGRNLSQINQLRREYANPGVTIHDDNACWLAYEFHNERNMRHLGRSIPILSTENGYLVGESTDPRYPATTPELHMAQTLEACRVMMGVSQRFPAAPEYYFCTAFTLIANAQLGSNSGWWEGQAWFSNYWADGVLPIVKALRAEPKVLRQQLAHPVNERTTLIGTVLNLGAGGSGYSTRPVIVLDRNGSEYSRTEVDNANRYRFPDLMPGVYTVRVDGTDLIESITIHPGESESTLNLDMASLAQSVGKSTLSGRVRGGAEAVVMLVRADDGEEWVNMARPDGTFRFVDLPAGIYSVRVHPNGSQEQGIILDGENNQKVDLAIWGWGYTVTHEPQKPGSDSSSALSEFVPFEFDGPIGDADEDEGKALDTPWAETSTARSISKPQSDSDSDDIDSKHDDSARDDSVRDDSDRSSEKSRSSSSSVSSLSTRATVIRCSVEGHKNVQVFAEASDWTSPVVETGSAPQYGEFACVLDLLSHRTATRDQTYAIIADGVVDREGKPVALEATVTMIPGQLPTVRFIYQETHLSSASSRSQIRGRVIGGAETNEPLRVKLLDNHAQEQNMDVGEDGNFTFTGLRAGIYSVMLVGYETEAFATEIALDGSNEVFVELTYPRSSFFQTEEIQESSSIKALVPQGAGSVARLVDRLGNERTQVVGPDEYVYFERLEAGVYTLRVDGGYSETGLTVDGVDGLEIFFSPLITQWKAEVNAAGSMPGFSAVRAEVRGRYDHEVFITKEDWHGMQAKSGSRPDLGEFALEFSPLEPGTYRIAPRELNTAAEIELTGLEAVWVTFFEQTVPHSPNTVLPLHRSDAQEDEDESGPDDSMPQDFTSDSIGEIEPKAENQSEIDDEPTDVGSFSPTTDAQVEQPGFNQPDPDQLEYEQSESEDPVTEQLANEEPVTDQPVIEESVSDQIESDMSQNQERSTSINESIYSSSYGDELSSSPINPQTSLANAAENAERAIAEYLFVEGSSDVNLQKTIDSLIAVLRYVAENQPEIGSSIEMARNADRVVTMGRVSQQVLAELKAAGIEVEQASSSLLDAYKSIQ